MLPDLLFSISIIDSVIPGNFTLFENFGILGSIQYKGFKEKWSSKVTYCGSTTLLPSVLE